MVVVGSEAGENHWERSGRSCLGVSTRGQEEDVVSGVTLAVGFSALDMQPVRENELCLWHGHTTQCQEEQMRTKC